MECENDGGVAMKKFGLVFYDKMVEMSDSLSYLRALCGKMVDESVTQDRDAQIVALVPITILEKITHICDETEITMNAVDRDIVETGRDMSDIGDEIRMFVE
jgi:hypothetical protein